MRQRSDSDRKASRARVNVLGPKLLDTFMALAGSGTGCEVSLLKQSNSPEVAACYARGASELDEC